MIIVCNKNALESFCILLVTSFARRAIAHVVSHWLPTVVAQVQALVRSCGICGGQSGTGAGFLSTSVSPANSHSTDCSTFIIYHPWLVQ
jgi:hypothetical protein